jgi:hypothetical protein
MAHQAPVQELRCRCCVSAAMPLPLEYQQQLQERRTAEERAADRETRRDLWLTLGQLLLSTLLGMALIGLALHVVDEALGRIWWWLGWLIWTSGVWAALVRAYVRGVARGDWQ